MFIRVILRNPDREIIVNTAHIWKIEVTHHLPGRHGAANYDEYKDRADAYLIYKVFVGGEVITLASTVPDPVLTVIEDIYKNALKSPERSEGMDEPQQ